MATRKTTPKPHDGKARLSREALFVSLNSVTASIGSAIAALQERPLRLTTDVIANELYSTAFDPLRKAIRLLKVTR